MNSTPRAARPSVLLAACALLYVLAVVAYATWSHARHKADLMAQIDSDLLQAARSLKYLLPPDFHDRALDTHSIAMDEELRNRKAVTDFGVESGFKWVYTLAEKDGRFFFSAPSVSEEEAKELASWYFYPYEDVPAEFADAFQTGSTAFAEYTDQWGTFRSVALPQLSPAGRRYLACADKEIGEIHGQLRASLLLSILTALFFLAAILPFILLLALIHRAHTADLKQLNAELQANRDDLERQVQARTADLRRETHLLQEALGNVKVLGGLVPICSACKKIRDDQGYWNQLERYIQQNSNIVFSHGLCPECDRKLFPKTPGTDAPQR